jgi:flavodoxin I
MEKTGVFYGSSTGNTEAIAESIREKLGPSDVDIFDVAVCSKKELEQYQFLIMGVPTWGLGDLQEDWEAFLPSLESADLRGKTVAIYGLGDQDTYPDSFVDGMRVIYDILQYKGCRILGKWPVDGYYFDTSDAVVDNFFVGLVLDEDSQGDLTEKRLTSWLKQISREIEPVAGTVNRAK